MVAMKGYIEWVTDDKVGFITNSFGRILYVNPEWPDGSYVKCDGITKAIAKRLRERGNRGRSFNKEELVLELL